MKFTLCDGPISIITSDGKTLNVNWDVGHPDKNTIKTMFDISIKDDRKNPKNIVWNGSSWMEVNQIPEFQKVSFESEAYRANWNQLGQLISKYPFGVKTSSKKSISTLASIITVRAPL